MKQINAEILELERNLKSLNSLLSDIERDSSLLFREILRMRELGAGDLTHQSWTAENQGTHIRFEEDICDGYFSGYSLQLYMNSYRVDHTPLGNRIDDLFSSLSIYSKQCLADVFALVELQIKKQKESIKRIEAVVKNPNMTDLDHEIAGGKLPFPAHHLSYMHNGYVCNPGIQLTMPSISMFVALQAEKSNAAELLNGLEKIEYELTARLAEIKFDISQTKQRMARAKPIK